MKFQYLFLAIVFGLSWLSQAQSDTLNQVDAQGLKQGYWIVYGKDVPEKGHCHSCKVEEGTFLNNRKQGVWIYYYPDGINPRLIGAFENGRPCGEYTKFYSNGIIKETGHYCSGKNLGWLRSYYETGCIAIEHYFDENGLRDSDKLFAYENDCFPDSTGYGTIRYTGMTVNPSEPSIVDHGFIFESDVVSFELIDSSYFVDQTIENSLHKPCSARGYYIRSTEDFRPNGRNDVYNDSYDLVLSGNFKNGVLYSGRRYVYNELRELTSLEVYHFGRLWRTTQKDKR